MNKSDKTVKCPNCGTEIDVNELVYLQAEEASKKKYADMLAEQKSKYEGKLNDLNEERAELASEKERQAEIIEDAVKAKVESEKKRLQERLKTSLAQEHEEEIKSLKEELDEKSVKLKEYNRISTENERLKREKDELEDSLKLEMEKQINEKLKEEKQKIQKTVDEKAEMTLREKQEVIDQLKRQLQDAQRRAEQGSMQLQGEVQELAIEQWLQDQFPLDAIEEIKKGAQGGDCIQTVNTREMINCGKIYYESKRTKNFSPAWIEKFKADCLAKGVNIGVLVTQTMPSDMNRMGQKDGIWICTFEEFKGLSSVLRESLILLGEAVASQENKGEKMSMLYDFLTGNEFKMQVEAIVEGFSTMHNDLETEKRAMNKLWKQREKQIQKVVLNTTHMYGSIKGIAGAAIATIPVLELPVGEDDNNA